MINGVSLVMSWLGRVREEQMGTKGQMGSGEDKRKGGALVFLPKWISIFPLTQVSATQDRGRTQGREQTLESKRQHCGVTSTAQ